MAKIIKVRNVILRHYNTLFSKNDKVPLSKEVANLDYWKDCGVLGAEVKIGDTFTLKRQAKTVVKKFSGFIDQPVALEVYVDFENGGIGNVIIYMDPSVDKNWDSRLSGKESSPNNAHVIGVSINYDYDENEE